MSILGLDIGSDTIKIVEMAGGRGGMTLRNYAVASTPAGAVTNGDVTDTEAIAEAIRTMIRSRKIKSKTVVSSVQGQQSVVVRIIQLPRMSKAELDESMKYEVERHIPFPATNFIMDYQAISRPGEPNDSPNMEVLFAAAIDSMIEDHFTALQDAKLVPKAIDVQPLALGNCLVQHGLRDGGLGETVAVVNIGATATDLSIIKDGLLQFPRSIPIGGRSITKRISEGLGIGESQADNLKRRYGSMKALSPEMAARLARASQPEEEAPVVPTLDFGADLFDLDPGDSSDVGFGGGLSFGAPGGDNPPEVHFDDDAAGGSSKSPLELSDAMAGDGPLFDFGADATMGPGDDVPEARFDDEGTFDFGGGAGDSSTPSASTSGITSTATDEATFDFGLATDEKDHDGPEPAFSFDLDDAAPAQPKAKVAPAAGPATAAGHAPAASEESFHFDLDDEASASSSSVPAGAAPAKPAAPSSDDTFMFDFGADDTPAVASAPSTATASGSEAGPDSSFDFKFDVPDAGSSMVPAATAEHRAEDAAGSTEVGSSYDLGFLASDEGSGTGGTGGDSLDLTFSSSPGEGAAAAAAGVGGMELLSADDEERLRVREVMEPVIRDLAQEVARSLEYYRSRYEGAVVDRVTLVGGSARIDGLAEFFEEELGLPVDNGDPLQGVSVDRHLADEDLQRDAPLLAVAVGLAMRELM